MKDQIVVRAKHVPRRYSNATLYLRSEKDGNYSFVPHEEMGTRFATMSHALEAVAKIKSLGIPEHPLHWRAHHLAVIHLFSMQTEEMFEGMLVPMVGKVHFEYLQEGNDVPIARSQYLNPLEAYR